MFRAGAGANRRGDKTMSTASMNMKAHKPLALGVAAAIALGGAFALGATAPAGAAPISVSQSAVKEAVPDNVIDVRRRYRGHRGGHAVAGLALGIIGAAIAAHQYDRYHRRQYQHQYYQPHYYQPHHYYGPPSCIRRHGAVYCR